MCIARQYAKSSNVVKNFGWRSTTVFFLCFVYFHHQEESTWEMQELLGDTSNASVEMDGWMHTAHGEREKGVT